MISVVITLIVVGVLLWLVEKYIPMNQTIRQLLIGFVAICVVFYLLHQFGVFGNVNSIGVPHR